MKATLEPAQIDLLRRIYYADRLKPSVLHDFKDLMGDDLADQRDGWLDETQQDFEALGFLDSNSGATFGGPIGRLSPQGRWFVESLDQEDGA